MKLIYIAGKYTGKTYAEVENNIRTAEALAVKLWANGWAVICTHLNSAHFEKYEGMPGITPDIWLNGCLEIVKRCDALITTHDFTDSHGALKEYLLARKEKIRVFSVNNGIPRPDDLLIDIKDKNV